MPSTSSPISPTRKSSTCSPSSSSSSSSSSSVPSLNTPRSRSSPFHQDFLLLLNHLARPLSQLVHSKSGAKAPDWPSNILNYHLLSAPQLDNLSRFFNQTCPSVPETQWYPRRLEPWLGTPNESEIDLNTRRHRFGYFIGLYARDSPAREEFAVKQPELSLKLLKCFEQCGLNEQGDGQNQPEIDDDGSPQPDFDSGNPEELHLVQDMRDWMEWEWQLALTRARDESDRFARHSK